MGQFNKFDKSVSARAALKSVVIPGAANGSGPRPARWQAPRRSGISMWLESGFVSQRARN